MSNGTWKLFQTGVLGSELFYQKVCTISVPTAYFLNMYQGAQWLSGRVFDSRPRGWGFQPHQRHCVVVLQQDTFIYSLVLVQPRKTHPCLIDRLLTGSKEWNQTKSICINVVYSRWAIFTGTNEHKYSPCSIGVDLQLEVWMKTIYLSNQVNKVP